MCTIFNTLCKCIVIKCKLLIMIIALIIPITTNYILMIIMFTGIFMTYTILTSAQNFLISGSHLLFICYIIKLCENIVHVVLSYWLCNTSNNAVVLEQGKLYWPRQIQGLRPNTIVWRINTGSIWKHPVNNTFINLWLKLTN